jgi:hypothetical protein
MKPSPPKESLFCPKTVVLAYNLSEIFEGKSLIRAEF